MMTTGGHVGRAIRAMRRGQGLTLRQLAESAGCSYAYLSLVERGQRTPSDRWLFWIRQALAWEMLHGAA